MKLNNPKLWAVIVPVVTALGGYFGYEPIQQLQSVPSVDVDVHIPEHTPHVEHSHKNWSNDISNAVEKSMDAHNDKFH